MAWRGVCVYSMGGDLTYISCDFHKCKSVTSLLCRLFYNSMTLLSYLDNGVE